MSQVGAAHPSFLALDKASLGLGAADVESHLASCEACRRYVDTVSAPAPQADLEQLRLRIARAPSAPSRARWVWLGAPLAAAAALAVLVGVRPQPSLPERPLYIGEKGFSSVWIYVRHGSTTALWDGKKPVVAGDRLRMKVDPGKFTRVEVYSTTDPDAPELLYRGDVRPGQSVSLPDAWEIDAEPGDERLLVVLSSEVVRPVWADWLRGKASPGVLLLPFVLPKSKAPEPSPGSTEP
jgi:hypothetical protein